MKKLLCLLTALITVMSLVKLPIYADNGARENSPYLNKTNIDLPVDYFTTLTVMGAAGKVEWSTDNKKVAVAQSKDNVSADIIGMGTGETCICAKTDGITLKCRVTVKQSFIAVSNKNLSLNSGESATIELAVSGSRQIAMNNSNKEVCSVSWGKWDNGKISLTVTAKSSGNSEITVYNKAHAPSTIKTVAVNVGDLSNVGKLDEAAEINEFNEFGKFGGFNGSGKSSSEKPAFESPWKRVEPEPKPVSAVLDEAVPVSVIEDIFPVSQRVTETYEELCAEMRSIIKKYPYECEVLMESREHGRLFSYNTGKNLPGGCTIKVPYVYYCCTQLEKGIHSLDEKFTYQSKHKVGGSGSIRYTKYGSVWTVEQLIDKALRESDNVAYFMLVDIFGKTEFNKMVGDWGYTPRLGASNYPRVSSEFLNCSMFKMREKVETSSHRSWDIAWKALVGGISSSGIREVISYCDVAIKCGIPTSKYYNEVCYIDSGSPYVLVVMAKSDTYEGDSSFYKSIAECAEKINRVYEYER